MPRAGVPPGKTAAKMFVRAMVFAVGASLSVLSAAADPVQDGRSTPGTVVPSSGTTAGARIPDAAPAQRSGRNAGSLSGPASAQGDRCAVLRKRYAQSQACFERFRLKNGGLRPGASRQCKQIQNPAVKCGSEVVG
jgi:hypothetical protein